MEDSDVVDIPLPTGAKKITPPKSGGDIPLPAGAKKKAKSASSSVNSGAPQKQPSPPSDKNGIPDTGGLINSKGEEVNVPPIEGSVDAFNTELPPSNKSQGEIYTPDAKVTQQQLSEQLTDTGAYEIGYSKINKENPTKEDYGEAEKLFAIAANKNPLNTKAIEGLAYVNQQKGKYKNALDYYKQAQALDPQNANLANGIAYNALRVGDLETANENNALVLKDNPIDPSALLTQSLIQDKEGNGEVAKATLNNAIKQNTLQSQSPVINELAEAYFADPNSQTFRNQLNPANLPVIGNMAMGLGEGVKNMYEGAMRIKEKGFSGGMGYLPDYSGTLQLWQGAMETAFAAGMANPAGIGFMSAMTGLDYISNDYASKILMSPLESFLPPTVNEDTQRYRAFGDAAISLIGLGLAHAAINKGGVSQAKFKHAADLFFNGNVLSGEQMQHLFDGMRGEMTLDNLKKLRDNAESLPKSTDPKDVPYLSAQLAAIPPEVMEKIPSELNPYVKIAIAGLLQKKAALQEKRRASDDTFHPNLDEKIEAIKKDIDEIIHTSAKKLRQRLIDDEQNARIERLKKRDAAGVPLSGRAPEVEDNRANAGMLWTDVPRDISRVEKVKATEESASGIESDIPDKLPEPPAEEPSVTLDQTTPPKDIAANTKFTVDGIPLNADHEKYGLIADIISDRSETVPQLKKTLKDIIAAYKAEPQYKAQAQEALNNIDQFKLNKNYDATAKSEGTLKEGDQQPSVKEHTGVGTPRNEKAKNESDNSNSGGNGERAKSKEKKTVKAFRSIEGEFKEGRGGVQYFASDEKYSKVFGKNTKASEISLENSFDLEKVNEALRAKGVADNEFGQGKLTVSESLMKGEMETAWETVATVLGRDEYRKLKAEFDKADVVYGEDAGNKGQITYAVRNKESLLQPKEEKPQEVKTEPKPEQIGGKRKFSWDNLKEQPLENLKEKSDELAVDLRDHKKGTVEHDRIKDRQRVLKELIGDKEKTSVKSKAKKVADKVRKVKAKPLELKDKDGNPLKIQINGLDWNDLVEAVAKAIEKSGEIVDSIIAELEKHKWYKNLSFDGRKALVQAVQKHFEFIRDHDEQAIEKKYKINITNAVESDVNALMGDILDAGRGLEQRGYYDEADRYYDSILNAAQGQIIEKFKDLPEISIEINRTKGNFFGKTEPSFDLTITDTDHHFDEIEKRAAELAQKFGQTSVHVSEVVNDLPEGKVFGEMQSDGSVFEPNVDIKFDAPLSDEEIADLNKKIQELGLAGATVHPDKKGVNLYNISKFKSDEEFINEVAELKRALQDAGRVPSSIEDSVRKLWNIGEEEGGATVSYEDLRRKNGRATEATGNTRPEEDAGERATEDQKSLIEATRVARAISEAGEKRNEKAHQIKEKQAAALEKYAKENGLFIEDFFEKYAELKRTPVQGYESETFLSPDGLFVDKANSAVLHGTWHDMMIRVLLHNIYFPATKYDLLGFTKNRTEREGVEKLKVVLRQPFVKFKEGAEYYSIEDDLAARGIFPDLDEGGFADRKNGINFRDLHHENVVVGEDNNLYYLDPMIEVKGESKLVDLALNEPEKFSLPLDKDTENKKLQAAKDRLAEAKEEARKLRESQKNLRAFVDPFEDAAKQAEVDRNLVKAYLGLAKAHIEQFGADAIKTIEDFARSIGQPFENDLVRKAFEVFKGNEKLEDAIPNPKREDFMDARELNIADDDKAILSRLMQSDIPEAAKAKFEKEGLKYDPHNQEEARNLATEIVKFSGESDAIAYAEANRFSGDINSSIFAVSIDRTAAKEQKARAAGDIKKADMLARRWAEFAIRYDRAGREGGRFISQIYDWYKKSPLGIRMKEEMIREKAFDEWFKPKEAQDWKPFFDALTQNERFQELVKAGAESFKAKSKRAADRVRKGKLDNDITLSSIPFAKEVINGAIEIVAKTIEAGGILADAVKKGIDQAIVYAKDTDWYRALDENLRPEAEAKLRDYLNRNAKEPEHLTPEEKRIKGLEESIVEYDKKIAALERGEIPKGRDKKIEADRIEELKKRRDERRKEYEKLKKDMGLNKRPDRIQEVSDKIKMQRLRDAIAAYDKKIAAIKSGEKPERKQKSVDSAPVEDLKKQRDEKQKEYRQLVRDSLGLTKDKEDALVKRWSKKISGLSTKNKERFVRGVIRSVLETGKMDYGQFKLILQEALGLGKLGDEEVKIINDYVQSTNDVTELGKRAREQRTPESLVELNEAEERSANAATTMAKTVYRNTDLLSRFTGFVQLTTLGIGSILRNPFYNVAWQAFTRFPRALIGTAFDYTAYGVSLALHKAFDAPVLTPDTNTFLIQKEYFRGLGYGIREAWKKIKGGATHADYFKVGIQQEPIRVGQSWKDLKDWNFGRGEKTLTTPQVIDKVSQATTGIYGEAIGRSFFAGDVPPRYAAEYAATAQIGKLKFGLKDRIDIELLAKFPKEESKKYFLEKGMSEEEASKRSEEIEKAIQDAGHDAVMTQDNLLNDLVKHVKIGLSQLSEKYPVWGKATNIVGRVGGVLSVPYMKIPINVAWMVMNLRNPVLSVVQSMAHAALAAHQYRKGDVRYMEHARKAKYWMSTAAIGVATNTVAAWMANNGIVSPRPTSQNKQEKSKKIVSAMNEYDKQYSVNIHKLLRGGGDTNDGDVSIDLQWFGALGGVMNNAAQQRNKEAEEGEMSIMNELWYNMSAGGIDGFTSSVFGNTSAIVNAYQMGGGYVNALWINYANTVMNVIEPAAVAQTSKYGFGRYMDVRGDTFGEALSKDLYQRAYGIVGERPPTKQGVFGEAQVKEGSYFGRVLTGTLGLEVQDTDKLGYPIYEMYNATHDATLEPPAIPKAISIDVAHTDRYDEKGILLKTPITTIVKGKPIPLNLQQQRDLTFLIGQSRIEVIGAFLNDQAVIHQEEHDVKRSLKKEELPLAKSESSIYNKKLSEMTSVEMSEALKQIYEMGAVLGTARFKLAYPEFRDIGVEEPDETEIGEKIKNLREEVGDEVQSITPDE